MIKILVTPQGFELFGDNLVNIFGDNYDVNFVGGQIAKKDELIQKLKEVDGCVIGGERIDREVIEHCPNLKILSRFGVGYSSIDIEETKKNNTTVTIVPDISSKSVARHCLSLMLTLTNNIIEQNNYIKYNNWKRSYNVSPELMTVGLIGFGSIGREFGKLCLSLGYNVQYYSRTDYKIKNMRYKRSVNELIKTSDIISLHIKSTKNTIGIINKERIDLMKDKYFLNTARADLVDEDYLFEKVAKRNFLGVGLDVFNNEPTVKLPETFRTMSNVVCTAHVASYDVKSIREVALKSVNNIKYYFENKLERIDKIV